MRLKFLVPALVGLCLSQASLAQEAPAEPASPPQPAAETAAKPQPAPPPAPAQMAVPAPWPDPASDQQNILYLDLSTGGRVTIQLRPDVAPGHVERVKALVGRGFYDGIVFHRVIEGFMAQTGDPTGTGEGGSELPDLKAEFNLLPHLRGTVSMARTNEPDTANSQFFIMFMPRTQLDRKYTAFGRVIAGMQYVDAIERGEPPASPSRIVKAAMATQGPAPVAAAEAVTAKPEEAAAPPK